MVFSIFSYATITTVNFTVFLSFQKETPYSLAVTLCLPPVWVSYGSCNKLPQNSWFKTTEMYSFTIQEARSPKWRCWQGCLLLEALRCKLPRPLSSCFWWLLAIHGIRWLVTASRQSLPVSSHGPLPCVSLCVFMWC